MTNKNVEAILNLLASTYPHAHCELIFNNPFELLIATILSAQATDQKVNQVTTSLFAQYPNPTKMLELSPSDLGNKIRSIGLFRTKAKNILETCLLLINDYGGEVPSTMEQLVKLPGVGRKTASVVLANAFGIPAFPVDTHVQRVAKRLGLTTGNNPLKVEKDLTSLIPEQLWIVTHHRLIFHGRRLCSARKPQCNICPFTIYCSTGGSGFFVSF
jgi:endonuclease-3